MIADFTMRQKTALSSGIPFGNASGIKHSQFPANQRNEIFLGKNEGQNSVEVIENPEGGNVSPEDLIKKS